MNWVEYRLGDVMTLQRGHDLPEAQRQEGTVPVVSSSGITGFHARAKASAPGVVTGRYGTLGQVFYLEEDYWPLNTALYVVDFKGNNPRFVAYLLEQVLKNYQSDKAAVPGVNRNVLHELPVRVPPHSVQDAIADQLAAYDDLLENNRRRIQLLEKAASLQYREWFVHRRIPGGRANPSAVDLPEGWARRTLGEIAHIVMGQSPESKYYNTEGVGLPFHQGVTDFGDHFVTHRVYCTFEGRLAEARDILCSVRAPVGRINVTPDRAVIGRGLAALRSKTGHQSLLRQQLTALFYKEDLFGSGTIFAAVNRKQLESLEVTTAPEAIANDYEERASLIDDQIGVLVKQSELLRSTRDLLLPRLVSGQTLPGSAETSANGLTRVEVG